MKLPMKLAFAWVWILLVTGCTSFRTAVNDFDAVRGESEKGEPDEVAYQETIQRLPWVIRMIQGTGLGVLFSTVLRPDLVSVTLDNPAGFARENLVIMVAKSQRDIHRIAEAASRCLWVLDLDPQPLNKIMALRGVEEMLSTLDLNPMDAPAPDPSRTTVPRVRALLDELAKGWPGTRDGEPLADELRGPYLQSLAALTELPLPRRAEQRSLIRALDTGLELEGDPLLVQPMHQALLRVLHFGLAGGLRDGLDSSDPDVRVAAMRSFRALVGPDGVAMILARIARSRIVASAKSNRYDDTPFVRLSLIRMCGQLDRSRATRTFEKGPPPVEFLYETAVGDPDPGLRLVALEALAHCLGRPIDFDPAWAKKWWLDFVTNRHTTP